MTDFELSIEAYCDADKVVLAQLICDLQDFERVIYDELKSGESIMQDYCAEVLNNVRQKDGALLMARIGCETVAFIAGWQESDDDPLLEENARDYFYISDLFVSGKWRKRGIANALISELEKFARKKNFTRMRVCSKAANVGALTCYERMGYKPYEIILNRKL